MRERIIEVIQRGLDKDHASETIADAVLDALMEPDEGVVEAWQALCVYPDEKAKADDAANVRDAWTTMLTAARSGRSGER